MLPLLILKYFDVRRLLHSVISARKLYQMSQNPITSLELYQDSSQLHLPGGSAFAASRVSSEASSASTS